MDKLEGFYKDLLARETYLKSLEQTDEVKARMSELTLAIVAVQQYLLKSIVPKTCKTCDYWGVNKETRNQQSECRFHGTIAAERTPNALKFDVTATAHDDSGLEILVTTGEDFGCVHYKHK